jgi:hypothetical protein
MVAGVFVVCDLGFEFIHIGRFYFVVLKQLG